MKLKYSEYKKLNLLQTLQYNYILAFYPALIWVIAVFILHPEKYFFTWDLLRAVQYVLLLPLAFSLVVGPLVVFIIGAVVDFPIKLVTNIVFLVVLPWYLISCCLVFVGGVCNFFITILFPQMRLEDDPELFRWIPYILLLNHDGSERGES